MDDSLKLYRGPLRDNEGTVILKDGEVIANDDNKFKLGVNFIVEGGVGKTGLKNQCASGRWRRPRAPAAASGAPRTCRAPAPAPR